MTRPDAWPLFGNTPCPTDEISALQGARDEGRQEGMQQSLHTVLEGQLSKRFGPLSAETCQRLT